MQPTSLPFTEQLSAAAAADDDGDVTGVSSSSWAEPTSSRVMTMPHRLPAAMHAFKQITHSPDDVSDKISTYGDSMPYCTE